MRGGAGENRKTLSFGKAGAPRAACKGIAGAMRRPVGDARVLLRGGGMREAGEVPTSGSPPPRRCEASAAGLFRSPAATLAAPAGTRAIVRAERLSELPLPPHAATGSAEPHCVTRWTQRHALQMQPPLQMRALGADLQIRPRAHCDRAL